MRKWVTGYDLIELANNFANDEKDCKDYYWNGWAGIVPIRFWPKLDNSDGYYGVTENLPWAWTWPFWILFEAITFYPFVIVHFLSNFTISERDMYSIIHDCKWFRVELDDKGRLM